MEIGIQSNEEMPVVQANIELIPPPNMVYDGESKDNGVETHHHRGSMHSSMLTNHFSSTRGKDEIVKLTWKNINYSTLVKGLCENF